MTTLEKQRHRRANPHLMNCPCGTTAAAYARGEFACQRCLDIEKARESEEISISLKRRYEIASLTPYDHESATH